MNYHRTKNIVTIAVITSMLIMESIDANILNIAIPRMSLDLMISPLKLKLAITTYLIGIAIFIPISGWISDRFGSKNTLLVSISAFCLSSFLCAVSKDVYSLSVFRFLQGVSGAFMVPVARLLLLKVFPKEKFVKIYLIMSIPTLIGPLMSPLLGGFLVVHYNWPAIFLVNIPIGILALIATYFYVDNHIQHSDIFSLVTYFWLASAISSLVFYLSIAASSDFSHTSKLLFIIIFAICTAFYIFFERKVTNHVINYALFKIKTFKACFMGNLILRTALGSRGFIIALFLQISLKLDPQTASYLLACATIGLIISRLLIKKVLILYGFKRILRISNFSSAISLILMLTINHINTFAILIFILNGLFTSVTFILMNMLCYADIKDQDYSDAVSLNLTIQQIAAAISVLIASYCIEFFNFIFKVNFSHITFTFSFILLALLGLSAEYYFAQLSNTDGNNLITHR